MEMSNRRKWLFIVVSVLLAFLIWFYIDSSEGNPVTITVTDVPIEFLNEETSLANKGLMLVSGYDTTVDLELELPRTMVYRFDPEEIRLVADLSLINAAGSQSLTYSVIYPPRISSRNITVKSPAVRTVRVTAGELFRTEVPIRCKVVGSVADGYVPGNVTLLPEKLELRGQQADVMQVSYAQVTLDVTGAKSTVVELLDYELYGYDDTLIENDRIHPASASIQATMHVTSVKDVPLTVDFTEAPGIRLSSFDFGLDHEFIKLSGEASVLDRVDEITLGAVNLSDMLAGEKVFTYEVTIPEGLNNLSGFNMVTLRIGPRSMSTSTVAATDIRYENYAGESSVIVNTESIPVTLIGDRETLREVTSQDLSVVADLSELSEGSGTYTVPATVKVREGVDAGTAGEYSLSVTLQPPAEEQPAAPVDAGTEETGEPAEQTAPNQPTEEQTGQENTDDTDRNG